MISTKTNINDISAAVNFLLVTARFSLGIINKQDLDSARNEEIDWGIFDNLIHYHRLESIIHDTFALSDESIFPKTTVASLKHAHKMNAAANLLLSTQATQIFNEFKNSDIPLLSTKGLAVENWLYEQPGLRSSGDIDLFIKTDDHGRALACMQSMGYKLTYFPDRLIPGTQFFKQYLKTQKDLVFVHNTNNVMVELHWRLSNSYSAFPLSFDKAWKTKSDVNLTRGKINSLAEDIHAVYLCYHGTKHCWQRLFWLYDIAKLMLKPEVDWRAVSLQAQHLKAETSLSLALVLASRIFLTPIPDVFNQHIEMIERRNQLADEILLEILADAPSWPLDDSLSLSFIRQQTNWFSRIHPSKNHILFEWIGYLFSLGKKDWESLKLPDCLTPLYRLWRPLRLLSKGLTSILSK